MSVPPKKSINVVSPEDWASTYGMKLALKVMEAVLKEKDRVGEDNYRIMMMIFLSGLISAYLKFALNEFPKDAHYSHSQIEKFAEQNFINLKQALGNAVAAGVQGGLQSWCGQELEYYCLIKPVPEATNKPC